jgi:hypothetical protein
MELLKEIEALKFPIISAIPTAHCKIFEDNSGALETATVHKFRPAQNVSKCQATLLSRLHHPEGDNREPHSHQPTAGRLPNKTS